jgi:hypothetical protein
MTNFLANPLTIVGIEKKVMVGRVMHSAYWLNHDPSGWSRRAMGRRRSNGVSASAESSIDVSRPPPPRVSVANAITSMVSNIQPPLVHIDDHGADTMTRQLRAA